MSSEDDDYMSDTFLKSLVDVRPSLIQNRAKKREVQIATNQVANSKKQKQEYLDRSGKVNNDRLQEALTKPIEASNKGFKLLAKMGYKPGQALGKESSPGALCTGNKPITVPIGISIKSDRGGLGRDAALRELFEKRREIREQNLRKQLSGGVTTEDFRRRTMQKAEERFLAGALKRCQMTCETLDTQNGVKEPEIAWFWPERLNDTEETEENAPTNLIESKVDCTEVDTEAEPDEYTVAEKVEMLSNYLRTSYKFCCWCGVYYENQEDLEQNCPGRTRDEH